MRIWQQIKFWRPGSRRRAREAELERELQTHLELEAEERQEAGLSSEEAQYAARRALGNTTQIKEDVRMAWGKRSIETLLQDLRFGLRQLRCNPGFTAVAIITLALGIGANTAIFSYVDAVMLRPLPYPHPERIVLVREQSRDEGWSEISAPDFIDWEHENTVFTAMAVENWGRKTLTDVRVPEDLRYDAVTTGYFKVFGIKPFLGRIFAPDEDQEGKQHSNTWSY